MKKHRHPSLMVLIRWLILLFIFTPITAYVVYLGAFYYQQRQMLFPAQDRQPTILDKTDFPNLIKASFPTSLGTDAGFAWYLPPPQATDRAPAVIIGHGNGEIADDWVQHADVLRNLGFGMLILGYPGHGHAAGSPSKTAIVESSLAAYDWLITQPEIDSNQVLLFGHSIGGAATLAIAQERPTQGAILLSAFASIDQVAKDRYLPPMLALDRFNNLDIIRSYNRPVYLMHGTQDTLVPPHHAELLHNAAPHSELHWLPCGHGGCINNIVTFWGKLEPIMRDMLAQSPSHAQSSDPSKKGSPPLLTHFGMSPRFSPRE